MKKPVNFVVYASIMLMSLNSYAGTISCGGKYFSSEDLESPTQSAVLRACGEPTERRGVTWIYEKKGKSLKFVDGELKDVIDIEVD